MSSRGGEGGVTGTARTAFKRFLALVNESGASSWQLLQNCYPGNAANIQGIPLALALTRDFAPSYKGGGIPGAPAENTALSGAVCRVHGGGFAGSIQAYIPSTLFPAYKTMMEKVFGAAAVTPLFMRSHINHTVNKGII